MSSVDVLVIEDVHIFEVPSQQFQVLTSSLAIACPAEVYSEQWALLKPLVRLRGCLRTEFYEYARISLKDSLEKKPEPEFIQVVFLEHNLPQAYCCRDS